MRVRRIVPSKLPPHPEPPTSPPSTDSLFRVQNTSFGAYLLAANKLRFKGAERASNSTVVELVFFDPDDLGPDLLRRFNVGAVELVNARTLFETRGYLMSEVKRVLAGVGDDKLPR
jgi:hypothetical protein